MKRKEILFRKVLEKVDKSIIMHSRQFENRHYGSEDIAQDIRLKIYKSLDNFKKEKSSIETFAMSTVKHCIRETLRSKKKIEQCNSMIDVWYHQINSQVQFQDPCYVHLKKIRCEEVFKRVESRLSTTEQKILSYKLQGMSVAKIAIKTKKTFAKVRFSLSGKIMPMLKSEYELLVGA
jgi:RNA polymerase sigma factor (sigma-70 family)